MVGHGRIFAQSLPAINSLSIDTKAKFSVSLVEILYKSTPLTEMLSSLKGAKENMCIFIAFTGSTSRAVICVACLKLTTLPGRIA